MGNSIIASSRRENAESKRLRLLLVKMVMPFYYLQLPFAAAIGFAVYAEVPDIWVWLGGAVICASGYYIARREAAGRRQA